MSALELRSGHKLLGWITCWVGVSGGVSVFLMSAFELQSGHKLFRVDQMLGCWFGQRVFLMSALEPGADIGWITCWVGVSGTARVFF